MKHRHRLTGVVAPLELHDAIAAALEPAGLHAVDHLHQLHPGEVPLFGPEQVKGSSSTASSSSSPTRSSATRRVAPGCCTWR